MTEMLQSDLAVRAVRGYSAVITTAQAFSVPAYLPRGQDERVSQRVVLVLLGVGVRPVQANHQQLRRKGRTHVVIVVIIINIKSSIMSQ